MEVKRVAVGIDFSLESELALEQALDIASFTGADVVLVHVTYVPEPVDVAGVPESTITAMRYYEEELERHVEEIRRRLRVPCERASSRGIEVSQMLVSGFPDQALARAASDVKADLVAVGTHGRTGLKRLMLGSVAERVARLSECSVLVARPGHSRAGYRRILVPCDFSVHAEAALKMALVFAAPGGRIDVLHCWQVPALLAAQYLPETADERAVGPLVESIEEGLRARGQELVARHQREGVDVRFEVLEAPPARGVRDRAEDYDLIMIGSHGRRGVRRLFLGSVAELTVRHAPCSVVVVHGE